MVGRFGDPSKRGHAGNQIVKPGHLFHLRLSKAARLSTAEWSPCPSRGNAVDPDVRRQLPGQLLDQPKHRVLGGDVQSSAAAGVVARGRGGENNASLGFP